MDDLESKSEVARIKRQIELEYEAAQRAMHGFAAGAGKHQFITARMENVGRCHERLIELVGEQEAVNTLVQAMEQAGSAQKPEQQTEVV